MLHQTGSFVLLVVLVLSVETSLANKGPAPKFDYLLLAQFWPPTSCYFYFSKEKCQGIPEGVKGFTLHGLWPLIPNSKEPIYCDNSTKFNYNEIKSLEKDLAVRWPYYDTKNKTGLWEHEWVKHGTCAVGLPQLRGEFNYFNTTLALHRPINLLGALQKRGIIPSWDKQYRSEDIYNAVWAEFKFKPTILCYYKDGKTYFDQVYLCMSKDFHLQDCVGEEFFYCPKASEPKVWFVPFERAADNTNQGRTRLLFRSEKIIVEEEIIAVNN